MFVYETELRLCYKLYSTNAKKYNKQSRIQLKRKRGSVTNFKEEKDCKSQKPPLKNSFSPSIVPILSLCPSIRLGFHSRSKSRILNYRPFLGVNAGLTTSKCCGSLTRIRETFLFPLPRDGRILLGPRRLRVGALTGTYTTCSFPTCQDTNAVWRCRLNG